MRRLVNSVGLFALACAPVRLAAQVQQADPDIFLATVSVRGGIVTVGAPVNITRRAGYDNQPSFAADGKSVFYTSTREDAQADIYRYDVARRRATRVTVTAPESEYSAAMIPGTDEIAMIRVERDSTQRLWRMPLGRAGRKGELGRPALEGVKPAGYFAFADTGTIALFVLGRPASLQVAHTASGRVDTVAMNVGRSIHRIPGSRNISYVSKAYDEKWWLLSLDTDSHHLLPVALMPNGVEDYAWLPDGRIVAAVGSTLVVCDPKVDGTWKQVADFATAGLSGITRLAISPAGDRIAFVAIPQ